MGLASEKITIGWKTSSLNSAIASIRYRALFPLLALEDLGFKNKICTRVTRSFLVDLDVLVIVKSFTLDDYWLAQEASRMGVPVVFDLCDNIFIEEYGSGQYRSPADTFLLISSVASAITVTTQPLADVVKAKIGDSVPVYIIPDGIENDILLSRIEKSLFLPKMYRYISIPLIMATVFYTRCRDYYGQFKSDGFELTIRRLLEKIGQLSYKTLKFCYRMKAKLFARSANESLVTDLPIVAEANKLGSPQRAVAKDAKKILWFGNHGAAHAKFGMMDLLLIQTELESIANELSVELVVISNNVEKYNKHILPMVIPSRYIEWSAESMGQHFADADVVVIPSAKDDFSICKSANRTVLAMTNGVPVVATLTPALEDLRGAVIFDDFDNGIRQYLTDKAFATSQVERGKAIIDQLYGQESIGNIWLKVIKGIVEQDVKRIAESSNPDLIVAVHLPQDISLALPVLEEANKQGLQCVVWINFQAIKRWPGILKTIQKSRFNFRIIAEDFKVNDQLFPSRVFALLSITESNLNPHRFTRELTKAANKFGIYTATMQHGFENIGLSYSDDIHNIKRIRFESSHIYTWGDSNTYHPDILKETLEKCVQVGCSKPKSIDFKSLPCLIDKESVVIGVFENLHWHRYSEDYRTDFINGVNHLAVQYPNITFIIKPHNAGLWLTGRYDGEKPEHRNVLIIDPLSSDWSDITAAHLLPHLSAVITTPSTIALDAARLSIPTAVVAQGLQLANYAPLSLIRDMHDWGAFVSQVLNAYQKKSLEEQSDQFIDRVLLSNEGAAKRIVDDIKNNKINFNR
ncbi:glycosyltransferase [Marinomonas primoryensis]|uniref:Glycosyl transferase family 1 domain-containing protein n=1 Tax=Marinomonas primoryensis TaxID=178399 RepID=A0ABV0KYW6_9GAMM